MTREAPVALAFGGMVAMAAGLGIGRFVYTPILPVMVESLHLSKAQAGLLASANFVGYLAGALIAMGPRLPGSRRRWLIGALAVSAATTGAMGLTSTMTFFLLLRLAGGIASAFILVFASALVLDRLAESRRGNLSSIHFAGVGAGIALAALLVAGLNAADYDWRTLWLANGAVSLLAIAVTASCVSERPEHRVALVGNGKRPRGLPAFIAAYGLFGFGYVITATFLVAVVRAAPGIRFLEPLIWTVVGLAAVPSVAVWLWAGSRMGVARAFAVACVVEAAGVVSSVLWPTASGAVLAAVCLGGTFMGITALGLVGARRLSAGDPRRTLAAMTAAFGVGQIIGPTFAGLSFDRTGSLVFASLVAAGALLVAAVLTARVKHAS